MSVRPLTFSCDRIVDAPVWTPDYASIEYRNLIVATYGTKVDFCYVCADADYLSQSVYAIRWTFVWDGDTSPTSHSENVCEKHAHDAFENYMAIGK